MPNDADQFAIALSLYRDFSEAWLAAWLARDAAGTTWTGDIVTEWAAEFAIVAPLAFDETTFTNASFEGGNASAIANMPAGLRAKALQAFRAELQPSYAAVLTTPPQARRTMRRGHLIRFSPC